MPTPQVRLRFGYVISLQEIVRDEAGRAVELKCTYDPETRSGAGPKVKGIIHWVSAAHALPAKVRVYDRLFVAPAPGADHDDGDFLKDLNPASLKEVEAAMVEPSLAGAAHGATYQFERTGYFTVDKDTTESELVLNRVVTLRDTWEAKAAAPAAPPKAKPKQQPKQPKQKAAGGAGGAGGAELVEALKQHVADVAATNPGFADWLKAQEWPAGAPAAAAAPAASGAVPDDVEAAVAAQGAEVRRLKEEEGLTKKDPRLSEAVAELLRLKALLPQ